MSSPRETYSHGHHASVLAAHGRRTAENSATYLLPHLRATDVLLDNMTPAQMSSIVQRHEQSEVVFEASGGLTLSTAAAVAATGVHFVAVGAITHSAPIADIALDLT